MPRGKLDVSLIKATGLQNSDLIGKMKCYGILTCGTEVQKSALPKLTYDLDPAGKLEPVWQEDFIFNISEGTSELTIKVMDKDLFKDDFIGEAKITLFPLLFTRVLPPLYTYDLIKDGKICGDVHVSLLFLPDEEDEESCGGCDE